jgi:hypothetical protein
MPEGAAQLRGSLGPLALQDDPLKLRPPRNKPIAPQSTKATAAATAAATTAAAATVIEPVTPAKTQKKKATLTSIMSTKGEAELLRISRVQQYHTL